MATASATAPCMTSSSANAIWPGAPKKIAQIAHVASPSGSSSAAQVSHSSCRRCTPVARLYRTRIAAAPRNRLVSTPTQAGAKTSSAVRWESCTGKGLRMSA